MVKLYYIWISCGGVDSMLRYYIPLHSYSCGGNLLLNVGPTHDGRIVPIFQERLEQMGTCLVIVIIIIILKLLL